MDWRAKSAIRHLMLAFPRGDRLYRWLAYQLLGSMSGMAAKWFRVFPSRVQILRDEFGPQARARQLWCFDSGTTIAAGLAMAIATDMPGLLTDRWDRLTDRYTAVSRRVLKEKGRELAELSSAPPGRLGHVLAVTAGKKAVAALRAVEMAYRGSHEAAEDPGWRGAIGCVFSSGTLEHYTPEQLEEEVARMARVLRPGGVMSHVVDHRDHRWHADKCISPLQHLALEEDEYLRRFGNPLEYHNRWLRSQYVELLSRHGFAVRCADVIRYTPDLVPLHVNALAAPFSGAAEEDLAALVTHFVAVRPQGE